MNAGTCPSCGYHRGYHSDDCDRPAPQAAVGQHGQKVREHFDGDACTPPARTVWQLSVAGDGTQFATLLHGSLEEGVALAVGHFTTHRGRGYVGIAPVYHARAFAVQLHDEDGTIIATRVIAQAPPRRRK